MCLALSSDYTDLGHSLVIDGHQLSGLRVNAKSLEEAQSCLFVSGCYMPMISKDNSRWDDRIARGEIRSSGWAGKWMPHFTHPTAATIPRLGGDFGLLNWKATYDRCTAPRPG